VQYKSYFTLSFCKGDSNFIDISLFDEFNDSFDLFNDYFSFKSV